MNERRRKIVTNSGHKSSSKNDRGLRDSSADGPVLKGGHRNTADDVPKRRHGTRP